MIGQRLLAADETFPFITSTVTQRRFRCKAYSSALALAPASSFRAEQENPPVASCGSAARLMAAASAASAGLTTVAGPAPAQHEGRRWQGRGYALPAKGQKELAARQLRRKFLADERTAKAIRPEPRRVGRPI